MKFRLTPACRRLSAHSLQKPLQTCRYLHSSPRRVIHDAEGLGSRAWGGMSGREGAAGQVPSTPCTPKISAASGVGKGQVLLSMCCWCSALGCWQVSCPHPTAGGL